MKKFFTKNKLCDGRFENFIKEPSTKIELEIGCNAGRLLTRIADIHRDRKFIGVEIDKSLSLDAYKRVVDNNLTNVAIINIEAHDFMTNFLNDNMIDVIHIYFPTPYPKSIGLQKRLICNEFIDEAYRVLKIDGCLRLLTDIKDYFKDILQFSEFKKWWAINWIKYNAGQQKNLLIGSPCEITYRLKNELDIYSLQLIRMS
jgi:tRNA (guanine-N7-)-methyltransferase